MHKLCEKCEKNSWCKLGTHEYMHPVLDSGCDGFHEKGKSKGKGKANPSAYHIGYAEGQRDAEKIKNEALQKKVDELYHDLNEAVVEMCEHCDNYVEMECKKEDGKCFVQRWRKTLEKARGE